MTEEFSIRGYLSLVEKLRASGYTTTNFHESDPEKRHLILRHDVDYDLESALTMAEAENAANIFSSYFLLVRSEFYNTLTPRGVTIVRRLQELGHEIGLHFDPSACQAHADHSFEDAIRTDCEVLEIVTQTQISLISFHRPGSQEVSSDAVVAGLLNAYGDRFVRQTGYCSDSRGAWHYGHPLDHPSAKRGEALHLLVHPIWWVGENMVEPEERLTQYLNRRLKDLDQELVAHCTVYRNDGMAK